MRKGDSEGLEQRGGTIEVDDIEDLKTRETFDYVVLSDVIGSLADVWTAFRNLPALCQPETTVVVLTTYADDRSVMDALRAGARGHLTKDVVGIRPAHVVQTGCERAEGQKTDLMCIAILQEPFFRCAI